jgi:hypothetical protein
MTRTITHLQPILAALLAAASFATSSAALAQHEHHAPGDTAHAMPSMQGEAEAAMGESMAGMKAHPHMRMTALRVPDAADSARARAVADTLRRALAKYHDVSVAEADGYKLFAPRIKNPRVYHYTKKLAAVKASFTFDPAEPTSLLYRRNASGKLELLGAMYTAPNRSSEDDLNARVPLSITQWHQHVNICLPKRGDDERWTEKRNGRMLFGPGGAISTKEDCDANNGRWRAQLFNWMVHANVFAGTDLATVWGDHH